MIFKNFKQAHEYYKYPGSHRIGSYGDNDFIIRSYSNGHNGDIIKNNGNTVYYMVKNERTKNKFLNNIKLKKKLRFFLKINEGVKDMGLYSVKKFYKGFVIFVKV